MVFTDWFGKSFAEMMAELGTEWKMIYENFDGQAVLLGPKGHAVSVWYDNNGNVYSVNDGSEKMSANCYGCLGSEKVYGKDNWVYRKRGFGAITSDRFLMDFAKEVTSDWYHAGWHRTFEDYYLGDYAMDHPRCDLTDTEYARLRELQKEARGKAKAEDDAREWRYDHTEYWADNSEEEVWIDKNGVEKRVMTVAPHGDLC